MCRGGGRPTDIYVLPMIPAPPRPLSEPPRPMPNQARPCLPVRPRCPTTSQSSVDSSPPLPATGQSADTLPCLAAHVTPSSQPRPVPRPSAARSSQVPRANWRSIAPNGRGLPRHQGPPVGSPAGPAGRRARANPVPGSGRPPSPAGGAQRTARPRRIQPRPPQSPALVTLRRRARIPRGPLHPTPPPGRVRPSADPGPSGPISPHYILSDTAGDLTDQKSVQPDRNL